MDAVMRKWEYKVFTPKMEGWIKKKVSDESFQELNDLGSEGWELVSVTPVVGNTGTSYGASTMAFNYFFKRPI